MNSLFIEKFYHFLQGILIFQLVFFVIVFIITKRKEVWYYCLYLLFTILYFFINAPHTFFNIDDNVIFNSSWYVNVNYMLLIGSIYCYIQFVYKICVEEKTTFLEGIVRYSTLAIFAFVLMFLSFPYLDLPRDLLFYFTHLLTLPIGIYIFYQTINYKHLSIRLLRIGIVINIFCYSLTLAMIVRYNSGIRVFSFDEYPLLFMRIGILIDIFFFQLVLLRKWHEQEQSLKTKDITSKLEIEKLRNEISRELHDDVGASLSKISLQAYMASNIIKENNEVLSYINSISKESKNIIANLKHIVHSFQAENKDYDLKERVKDYISNMSQDGTIKLEFIYGDLSQMLKNDLAFNHNIYMMIKEAISNALKYSDGNNITVNLNSHELIIKDNGKGFDSSQLYKGNGLKNIKKRCEVLNAEFQVFSNQNDGTRLVIKFSPLLSINPEIQ